MTALRVLGAAAAGTRDDTLDPFPVTEGGAMAENIVRREADNVFNFLPLYQQCSYTKTNFAFSIPKIAIC